MWVLLQTKKYLKKGYWPEISFKYRKEILSSIVYVNDVIPSPWLITNSYIKKNKIDILVHGHDNSNKVTNCKIRIFQRTKGVSSTKLEKRQNFNTLKVLNILTLKLN